MISLRGLVGIIGTMIVAGTANAADLSILPPGARSITVTMTKEHPAKKKRALTQKQFEDILSSPIGKGRLE